MIFCKVDVNFYAHEKFLAVGLDGVGLWLSGLAYARQLTTGGRVPDSALHLFGGERPVNAALQKLVDVGLWLRVKGGHVIFNYAEKGNQTKDDVDTATEAARKRKESSRARRGHTVTEVVGHTVTDDPQSRVTAGSSSSSLSDQDLGSERASAMPAEAESAVMPVAHPRRSAPGLVDLFMAGMASAGFPQSAPFGQPMKALGEAIDLRLTAEGLSASEGAKTLGKRWVAYSDGAPDSTFRAIDWLNAGAKASKQPTVPPSNVPYHRPANIPPRVTRPPRHTPWPKELGPEPTTPNAATQLPPERAAGSK